MSDLCDPVPLAAHTPIHIMPGLLHNVMVGGTFQHKNQNRVCRICTVTGFIPEQQHWQECLNVIDYEDVIECEQFCSQGVFSFSSNIIIRSISTNAHHHGSIVIINTHI